MDEQPVIHSTFVIDRTYPQPAQTVFQAFADPQKKRRWYGERAGQAAEDFTMDFRVHGQDRLAFRLGEATPFPGAEIVNIAWYQDIVPNQRIIESQHMTMNGQSISSSLITIEFIPQGAETQLVFTHQGAFLEMSGGPEMREAGWKTLFAKLDGEVAG